MPRLILLLVLAACGFLAACGDEREHARTVTIRPLTIDGHTITRVVIPPTASIQTGP